MTFESGAFWFYAISGVAFVLAVMASVVSAMTKARGFFSDVNKSRQALERISETLAREEIARRHNKRTAVAD